LKYYKSDQTVKIGDEVTYGGTPGIVVFIIDDDEYSVKYPKSIWSYLGKGVGIELQLSTPTLCYLDTIDDEEDLISSK